MQSTRRHAQITSFRHVEREGITEISHTMEGNFFCLISQSQIHIGVLGFRFLIDLCQLASGFSALEFVIEFLAWTDKLF